MDPIPVPKKGDDVTTLWRNVEALAKFANAFRRVVVRTNTGRNRFDIAPDNVSVEIIPGGGDATVAAPRLPWAFYASGNPFQFRIQPGVVQFVDGTHWPAHRNGLFTVPPNTLDGWNVWLVAGTDQDGSFTSLDFDMGPNPPPANTTPQPGSLAGTFYYILGFLTSDGSGINDFSNVTVNRTISLIPVQIATGTRALLWDPPAVVTVSS